MLKRMRRGIIVKNGALRPERGTGMSIVKRLLLCLLAAALVLGISLYLPLPDRTNEPRQEDPPPAAISIRYRDAEKILLATCMRITQTEDGAAAARFTVDEALVGGDEEGATLTAVMNAEPGRQYLLHLKWQEPQEETGRAVLVPVAEGLITVENGIASLDGQSCTLESIREDIRRQKKVLTVPSQKFFYNDFASLAAACDEVVICRVLSVSEPTETVCRSTQKGESTLSTLEQVFLRVRVENGLYGSLPYGEKLDVVLEPYYVRPVINATDLTAKTVKYPPESLPRVGCVYIFFLQRSEDVKSDIYFTVNPYEGYVLLIGDRLIHPYYNRAMDEMNDLKLFAERLKKLAVG